MLDNETKRRIDTARDILVGKLPDPKSQVEQITIALIYKFMDDMDAESVSFGGEPSFFVGDYEKYGWRKLLDANLGGFETLALYGEAMTKLHENENLPQLFRDIFKNAYLPYRDPETLKLFLKTINGFTYDHSERLGDAFEYLLSVLGSQGDAGQFRTPRHVIDFIVKVLDPKKTETISDPACGTAGFLISAYKHILGANQNLTPDERKRLMTNFAGYDISPDMVRLSLVNMYLHGFPSPHIYEYDSLTSEDRWSETFDIVMANPPFMSPKGGIKPHKKFSINANRSEVLFVDYIAEHIHPTHGRAGIIVPEGIIFQSANAYKDLRKMLVDKKFLYAVVSLPAGVFQPYSGVKTSVLLMDKTLAAKTDKILFVKIANDGFGLGAQRKELKTSDLPDALNLIRDFQAAILQGDTSRFENIEEMPASAVAVEKTTIAANGDYNLSADRYRISVARQQKFETIELGEVLQKVNDNINPQEFDGKVNYIGLENIESETGKLVGEIETTSKEIKSAKTRFKKGDILYGKLRPNLNKVYFANFDGICSTDILVLRSINGVSDTRFYSDYLRSEKFNSEVLNGIKGAQLPRVGYEYFSKIKIPLPPLSIQKEIVEKIESFQRIIDGAKQVVAGYKPQIDIQPDWEMVELGEACNFIDYRGKTPQKTDSGIRLITAKNVRMGYLSYEPVEFIAEEDYDGWMTRGFTEKGDVLITTEAPLGNVAQIDTDEKIALAQRIIALIPRNGNLDRTYLKNVLISVEVQNRIQNHATGSTVYGIKASTLKTITIPLPPLEEQKQIVAQIEREQSLVNANRELIRIFEQKIKDEINKLWEQ
ncbi:MAG: N-6 DNA methylase [Acidobacteriota bacterium]|nr:N-6 DNA methylase [Acidobacteriota bacterium]